MEKLHGTYALYFKSRARLADQKTWGKEKMPNDWTVDEVRKAARLAGCEGFCVMNMDSNNIYNFEWFVK